MSKRARKVCSYPGCPNLTVPGGSLCEAHELASRQKSEARRPSANARGYTSKWHKAAAEYLAEHPYCADNCGRPSQVVDHIKPHHGDQKLFWDQGNWQAMAKVCHDRKTAKQDGGFGNVSLHNGVGRHGWG